MKHLPNNDKPVEEKAKDGFLSSFSVVELRQIVSDSQKWSKYLIEQLNKHSTTSVAAIVQKLWLIRDGLNKKLDHPLAKKLDNYHDLIEEHCHTEILLTIYKKEMSKRCMAEIKHRGLNPVPGFSAEEHCNGKRTV